MRSFGLVRYAGFFFEDAIRRVAKKHFNFLELRWQTPLQKKVLECVTVGYRNKKG